MFKKFKEYRNYKKNKKVVKRELAKIGATTLPTISMLSDKGKNIANFLVKVTNEAKGMNDGELVRMVLEELAYMLETTDEKLVKIFTYIANLSEEDISKIITEAIIKVNEEDDDDED